MNIEKKIIGQLNKCYSMAPITVDHQDRILVAAEKQDPCYLFDTCGNKLETVWDGPGGVMTMQQIPGRDGEFLATQKFYSPNDSKEAYIAYVKKDENGQWVISRLADTPFVHRFGILDGWLIICCLKSGHEYKNDWSMPGAVYGVRLEDDFTKELQPVLITGGLLKNHGFSITEVNGKKQVVVGTENGTLLFTPPVEGDEWTVETISNVPSSDSVLIDLDGDGKPELGTIAPFHGNGVTIWHLDEHDNYVPQWKLPLPEADTEMVHATWAGQLAGKSVWAVGWRKGTRASILIYWNEEKGTYNYEYLDKNAGAANFMHFVNEKGADVIVATNREIDEIAMYTVKEEK